MRWLLSFDAAGNVGTASVMVTIVTTDTSAPVVTATVTFAENTTPPVITVPLNLTVEATGPSTAVDPGTAVAVDAVDGVVAVTPSQTGPFVPGVYLITWTARDAAGNTATARQTITVSRYHPSQHCRAC